MARIVPYAICNLQHAICKLHVANLQPPWRIGTLKYLEIKIEEWPNRAKWGQSGPNGAKWCQMMPNRVKRVQTGSNGLKRGQKGPYGAKLGQKGQTGQTKPNGVKW